MVKADFPSHHQADEAECSDLQRTIPRVVLREGHLSSSISVSNYDDHSYAENASGNALNRAFIAYANEDDVFNTTNSITLENSTETSLYNRFATESSTPFSQRTLPHWSCDSVPTPNHQNLSVQDSERGGGESTVMGRSMSFSSPMNVRSTGHTSEEMPSDLRSIASEGRELFLFILNEEKEAREAVEPGALSSLPIPPNTNSVTVLNQQSQAGGRTVREIAKAFARSPQRNMVRQLAQRVNIRNLNSKTFCDLLFGLFQKGGMTQERVLVLYFFCADLALRAFVEHLVGPGFQQLVSWTNSYISERLSPWVQEHGGWVTVLQDSVYPANKIVVGVICLSVVAFSAFLWLRIRS